MATIVALSGSLRKGSLNSMLLRAASSLMPSGTSLEIASFKGIPVYDGDLESESGTPAEVTALADRIATSSGLLLSTPEYNNGVPGGLKNAIDWLSRGSNMKRVFDARAIGIVGATPGPGGTRLAQAAWLPIFRLLGSHVYTGKSLYLASATNVFAEDESLKDDKIKEVLRGYLEGFVAFAARGK